MSTPTTPRPIAALLERQRLAALDETRLRLPLLDPDRHALDVDADTAFARLAPHAGGAA